MTQAIELATGSISAQVSHASVRDAVEELQSTVQGIVQEHAKLSKYSSDPALMADVYYDMSLEMVDSPDLRMTWLDTLSAHLLRSGYRAEAATTKVVSAYLALRYLALLDRWPGALLPGVDGCFARICPAVVDEAALPEAVALRAHGGDMLQASYFSVDGYVQLLNEAVALYAEAQEWEQAVATHRLLAAVYHERADYAALEHSGGSVAELCKQIRRDNVEQDRFFANYYRVAFYGEQFASKESADGLFEEFIYKELPEVRLAHMVKKLEAQFGTAYGASKVKIVPNHVVSVQLEEPTAIYIQVRLLIDVRVLTS